jgi:hypothetical protein
VPFAAYHELVAGFEGLFTDSGEDWPTFFARADGMKRLDIAARVTELNRLAGVYPSASTESASPRIHCLSLEYHDAD